MRHRVALATVMLGVLAAASAQAGDATQVIYDLSALRQPQVSASAPRAANDVQLPVGSLPMSSPSLDMRPGDGLGLPQGDDLEVAPPRRHANHGNGVGTPRDGQPNPGGNDYPEQPSPTPEPGTLLLLGGAIASGVRYARRR